MNLEAFNKILLFWLIFYITPGPVWLAVMATTAKQNTKQIITFFLKVFLMVSGTIQLFQAFSSVIFIEFVTKVFGEIGFIFYFFGSGYIFYLAFKAIKAQQSELSLELSFMNLAIIMLLSPKIWILFPSGAVIANELNLGLILNASVYAGVMFLVSSLLFFFYVIVGKIGQRVLKDNFSYLVFLLLSGFGLFLFIEGIRVIL